MIAANLKAAAKELGARTTYQLFLEREGIPVIRAFHIEDIRQVDLHPWPRMGGRGVYLNLEGTEGVNDCYISEIPPGRSLEVQKHMFEEMIFVISGRGATTVWRDGSEKRPSNGEKGFSAATQHPVPLQRAGDKPVRLLAMTNAPTILNLFHNIDFVFQCDYPFTDRY